MKKITAILIQILILTKIIYADTAVSGDITPIVIDPVFELKLVSWTKNGATGAQVGETRLYNGDLDFGTINMNSDGITATSGVTGAESYKNTPHRVASYYNQVQFWISNNQHENFKILVKASGSLLDLQAPLANESVMHMIGYDVWGSQNLTQHHNNIKILELTKLLNNTDTLVYADTDAGITFGEGFETVIALDFLPVTIPSGTYLGTMTYTLISGL